MFGDASQLAEEQPERSASYKRQDGQHWISAQTCHGREHDDLHERHDGDLTSSQRSREIARRQQALADHIAQFQTEQWLDQMLQQTAGGQLGKVEIVESLRVASSPIPAMMPPMLDAKCVEVDATQRTQQQPNLRVKRATDKQRAMSAVVHHHRDSVKKQADRRSEEPWREDMDARERRCDSKEHEEWYYVARCRAPAVGVGWLKPFGLQHEIVAGLLLDFATFSGFKILRNI